MQLAIVNFTATSREGDKVPWCLRINDLFIPISRAKTRFGIVNYCFKLENGELYLHWGMSRGFEPITKDSKHNWKIIYLPWHWEHYITEVQNINDNWVEKVCENYDQSDIDKDQRKLYKTGFTHIRPHGEVQERIATYFVERRKWTWKIFKQLKLQRFAPKKVITSISIDFNDETGRGSGSWKGGIMSCGFDLKPNETAEECFKRFLESGRLEN